MIGYQEMFTYLFYISNTWAPVNFDGINRRHEKKEVKKPCFRGRKAADLLVHCWWDFEMTNEHSSFLLS